jgi:hypothetical protein
MKEDKLKNREQRRTGFSLSCAAGGIHIVLHSQDTDTVLKYHNRNLKTFMKRSFAISVSRRGWPALQCTR